MANKKDLPGDSGWKLGYFNQNQEVQNFFDVFIGKKKKKLGQVAKSSSITLQIILMTQISILSVILSLNIFIFSTIIYFRTYSICKSL